MKISNTELSKRLDKLKSDSLNRELTDLEIQDGIFLLELCFKRNLPNEALKLKGIIGFIRNDK